MVHVLVEREAHAKGMQACAAEEVAVGTWRQGLPRASKACHLRLVLVHGHESADQNVLVTLSQRLQDDNKNKYLTFEGGCVWGQGGELSKNAVFFFSGETLRQ